ncbi:amino acid adenylation domain-containing protein [Solicola gregarius]|uniref:Amino acid adenylation domain-containing protein n=1 Tax=Solicola gregarius TaxID=2908642 RepID=A0AA46YJL9_9ACTN|nr:amino acid adenylation domain-containing protein [Solicola gregarius]UYM03641.1 amino acid adenylation domain-containing protein [Solicola gregarius]
MTTTSTDMFAVEQDQRVAVDLPTRFARYAAEHAENTAVCWTGKPWTFRMLATRAERYAALLDERVPTGGWVAICAERSPEVLALVLGAFTSGRAIVPCEPEHPTPRLRRTIADASPSLLVTDHTAARELTIGYQGDKALLDELAADAALYDGADGMAPTLGDIAYVIYTSGSTGEPKGVMVQQAQMAQLAEVVASEEPSVGAGNTVLAVASLAFDMMIIDIFTALANGATVVLPPGGSRQREPSVLLEAIEEHEVDTIYATPSLLQMIALAGLGTDGRRPVRAITGGEAMSHGLAATLVDRCSALYQGYGPTETTVLCSYHPVTDPSYRPLGLPSTGTTYYPVGEYLDVLPLNTVAELAIGGSMVAAGYHGRARLTAERFRPDPYAEEPGARCYLSGDLVRVDNDGGAIFAGRADTQVKIRGFRVELGEVEAAVQRQPGIRQCVAAAEPDSGGNTELVAYVVGDLAGLRNRLATELPASMVPTRFEALETIPLTNNGKPDRTAVADAARAETGSSVPAAEADADSRTELQRRIAQLWSEVLGAAEVELDQGFFDLGGHSLLAMEIVARIRSDFGVDLPVWELFSVPTVRAWAQALDDALHTSDPDDSTVRSAPATFAQAALCIAEQVVAGVTSPGNVVSVDIEGNLDVGELLAALDSVATRHELLRTRFDLRGVDSMQIVDPHVDLDFDESVCGDESVADEVREWAARPFDLSTGPLFRTLLVEHGAVRTLNLCFHDAIADAVSARLVVAGLAATYGTAGAESGTGSDPTLAPDAVLGFGDLARAQRDRGTGTAATELISTWRGRLPKQVDRPATDHSTVTESRLLTAGQHAALRREAERTGLDLAGLVLGRLRSKYRQYARRAAGRRALRRHRHARRSARLHPARSVHRLLGAGRAARRYRLGREARRTRRTARLALTGW